MRSRSLVKMGTTANQKKLFFNLSKAKSRISAVEEGNLRHDQVELIAEHLGVPEKDVVEMHSRLGGDISLNAPTGEEGSSGEWQDRLVDESASQELRVVEREESDNRRQALREALAVLSDRERRILEGRRLADDRSGSRRSPRSTASRAERVRQIEVRAFDKVRKSVRSRLT